MSERELVVLGTSSQAPTRHRNHSGYLLLWDDEGILVDPGEGTQRQLLHAGVRPTRITRVCLTHLHGDHCLGLPGILATLSQHELHRPVKLHYPASGADGVERLLTGSIIDITLDLVHEPVEGSTVLVDEPDLRIRSEPLDHSVDSVGWRIEQPPAPHLLPEALAERRVEGPEIARLLGEGRLVIDGREVTLDEVSRPGAGNSASFVFDTRVCEGATALAEGVDLLVAESTFLDRDADRAERFGHLTASQAARLAADGDAHTLVLTHFSARYGVTDEFEREARRHFERVIQADDLQRIPVPRRPRPS